MKPVIYQLVIRYFGNTRGSNVPDGDIVTNGCGTFGDIDNTAIGELKALGVTHVWLMGVPRQATLTDRSRNGLPAAPADVVKGRAGSPYAVCDYADVCPDYADDVALRMQEFEALVQRIHAAGLKVLIDLVPNHVSRSYRSQVASMSFGEGDDQTRFFDTRNNFYYLVDPPGRALQLHRPAHWSPPGVTFTGTFAAEDGTPGHTPRVTGGDRYADVLETDVDVDLWYETVKLNYGYDFTTGQGHYSPMPRTWLMMDAVLAFWQSKGVDGFRCDFAHYVPAEAWTYLLAQARERDAGAFFMAEAYPWEGSGDPITRVQQLIDAGFDAVYHSRSYEALKHVYLGTPLDEYEREMGGHDEAARAHYLEYLENHDERRVASPIVHGEGAAGTGFGSSAAGYQLAPLQMLYSRGPVMLLNGQEVGEPGDGVTGFKGDNGRSTFFDYWRMETFSRWVNGHAYDGGQLGADEKALRRFYADLFALCQDPAITGSGYWGLRASNRAEAGPGASDWLYAFARHEPASRRMLVVVANFRPGAAESGTVRVPRALLEQVGLDHAKSITVRLLLDETGAKSSAAVSYTPGALADAGFAVSVSVQACHVYALE